MIRETLLTLATIGFVSADPFPSDLERCHYGDTECLRDLINDYVETLKDGHEGLDLPPIDPLYVKELNVIQNAGPVKLSLRFEDFQFSGLSKMNVTKVIGFEKDPTTSKYELHANIPHAVMSGHYKSRGDILFLNIDGNGMANLTFDDFDLAIKCKNPQFDTKEGKQYVNLYKSECSLNFDVKRLWMEFEELFKGNKLLSQTINLFLNENWRLVLNELKPALSKSMCKIIKNVMARVFAKVPYNELLI